MSAPDVGGLAKDRFHLPEDVTYLDGNSLGPLTKDAALAIRSLTWDQWGQDLIRSWNKHDWFGAPERIGDRIAPLIGADKGEVVVADSVSVNIFKVAAAALNARPGRTVILSEPGNFPTDLYMIEGLKRLRPDVELRLVARDEMVRALTDDVALLMLTHVHYRTAALFDMAALTAAAHEAGALTLWDLSHSVGAVPVDLNGAHADMAVGCGYKYLNGGPGAPAFLYVAARHQEAFASPLSGWMGHAAPFDFDDAYRPAAAMTRWRAGTPPMLALAALEAGVDVMRAADFGRVVAASRALTSAFVARVESECADMRLISPRDPVARGSHVSFAHDHAWEISQALIEAGVIGDFRTPDAIRFGFAPLYNDMVDVERAVSTLSEILATGRWREARFAARATVT
ncbi:MAG: kynureninase [Pseudomonadota bacterium]